MSVVYTNETVQEIRQHITEPMLNASPPRSLIQKSCSNAAWTFVCSDETKASVEQFLEVTNLLLEQVQLNSTHLFRADILLDTTSELRSVAEKEADYGTIKSDLPGVSYGTASSPVPDPPEFVGYQHRRTIVRRLIPRKPQLDKPLEQSCFVYYNSPQEESINQAKEVLVVYKPHCETEDEMPWYHPKVNALAYLYSQYHDSPSVISVHYLPFPSTPSPLPDRLARTFQSLLKTMLRLLLLPPKGDHQLHPKSNDIAIMSLAPAALKDTILPQHIVQDTYARLKQDYATDLISRWVEKTEPSKHVFEDLSIAAFLIELWNTMYEKDKFPGFVDIACGNGVLVYILIKEGFHGSGFDARRRKTWEILDIDNYLHEQICIPKPFLDVSPDSSTIKSEMHIHDGIFPEGTFIISNHADELTCWTPLLATLSQPNEPLPFLAIPCCSHALDGSRHRYTLKDIVNLPDDTKNVTTKTDHDDLKDQPATGDLKALRAMKQKATGDDKSMYACLTRKAASLANELGSDVELTLMRIPSTRNIGIVGGRRRCIAARPDNPSIENRVSEDTRTGQLDAQIERECSPTGGLEASAQNWIGRARKLQGGQGRGKVNWNTHTNGFIE